ncbi:heparinase II/III family protein [Virgibacillus sp. C22-A2]|uniref:Heparinase II/III family protein n=1 Tax=Virgibacillus tibetensis TaxID=3042313 RepID=A0ABU6KDJ7_9BACI|nr:heparinase II/III family protein [Virgibacillus sp. C22-A2]
MFKSIITDYGFPWLINRSLYSVKLKLMRTVPGSEKLFEKKVNVKRVDIYNFNVAAIDNFVNSLTYEQKTEIITIADKAIEGKITGFSTIELNYGNPINWHYNPLTKKKVTSNKKWYQIPDFDPERGDIKAIWEASRFTHFFYLNRAFLITKKKKYYQAFSLQLANWLDENPYSYGPNYKCGQEATLRVIAALISYSVFSKFGMVDEKDGNNLKKLVEGSYKKVLSNFFYAKNCIKNNHTLTEITGLIIGSWCAEDYKSLKKAYDLLDKEIDYQFSKDGGYIQNSVNYQRFALQIIQCVIKLGEATKLDISEKSKSLVLKSARQLYQIQNTDGDVPNRGANDGALIFPITACSYRDFRPVINTINTLIDNRRVYNKGLYDEELLWFSNINNINEIPKVEMNRESIGYPKAGLYTLRYDEDSFLMVVLKDNKTRPTHMDQLHIDLWHRGKNILCDAGSYSYADSEGKKLSLTAAHNTVKFDNKEQMTKKGAFLTLDWSRAKNIKSSSGQFKGTMISKNGYKHTRNIEKTDVGYSIVDEVFGDGEFCEFYFHTPFEVKIISTGFELYDESQLLCSITTDGDIVVKKAYRSLYYLRRDEINCVIVRGGIFEKKCSKKFNIDLNY